MPNRSLLGALADCQPVPVPYVMIVESDEELARMLHTFLKEELQTEAIFAFTLEDAFNVVRALCPILFLINTHLLGADGMILVDAMRKNKKLATVPVILLTTEPKRDLLRAKERHIACLPLPFELTTLGSLLEQHLSVNISKKLRK